MVRSDEPPHSDWDGFRDTFGRLSFLSGKWTTPILYVMLAKGGELRFGEIKAAIPGITSAMLSARLKELESTGLVIRTQYPEIPVRVGYALTPAGQALKPIMDDILEWMDRFGFEGTDLVKCRRGCSDSEDNV